MAQGGAGASVPEQPQDSECDSRLDLIWSSQWRHAQDSNLRVRVQAEEWGVCPSNLVREIESSGRTPPPARMDCPGT